MRRHLHFLNGQPRRSEFRPDTRAFLDADNSTTVCKAVARLRKCPCRLVQSSKKSSPQHCLFPIPMQGRRKSSLRCCLPVHSVLR